MHILPGRLNHHHHPKQTATPANTTTLALTAAAAAAAGDQIGRTTQSQLKLQIQHLSLPDHYQKTPVAQSATMEEEPSTATSSSSSSSSRNDALPQDRIQGKAYVLRRFAPHLGGG
jgi:hypothetical protein